MDPRQQRGAPFFRTATSATLAQVTVKSRAATGTLGGLAHYVTDVTAWSDVTVAGINRGAIQFGSVIVWNFALSTASNIYNHEFKVPLGTSTGDVVAWVDGDGACAVSISGYSVENPA